MVLVEDVSNHSDSSPTSNNDEASSSASSQSQAAPSAPPPSIISVLIERKTDAVLLLSRLATLFFTVLFILPFFRSQGQVYYTKALLSAIVTSVLRLRQRLPNLQLSREFLFYLLREDSAHYLMYSFLFLSGLPMTIVLVPIATFAFLHSCSFLSQILTQFPALQQQCNRVTDSQVNLLRFIALNEIILMPILILSILVVRSNFLLIFMYYRFLTLRYASHRNPYTRNLFFELRQAVEQLCARPACPPIIARACHNTIAFVNRLAPTAAG
jgi:transmembrane protein 33